jgi:TatA/E family protein of Tat protein translocase
MTMPNIGLPEILIVLIIALVVFGPKKLPELGQSLGKGFSEFKGAMTGESGDTPKTDHMHELTESQPSAVDGEVVTSKVVSSKTGA